MTIDAEAVARGDEAEFWRLRTQDYNLRSHATGRSGWQLMDWQGSYSRVSVCMLFSISIRRGAVSGHPLVI